MQTIGTRTYTTVYNSYNEADQLTHMTYPSGQALYFRHDSIGGVSGLSNYPSGGSGTDYVSSHSHNIAGQVADLTYGNGVTEQFGYDAARMQLTSQKAGTASPYTNRMDLTYSYQAIAGQMGAGTTAGNAGQLTGISGNISGQTETTAYNYDLAGRLATSYTLSNNYSYDAAGNVTNDGSHSYTYDSENRLVTVDGTAASYGYDYRNRRYKTTVGSNVTHYIWKGGKVLAEHNGSTGAVQVNYIYASNQIIAKTVGGTTSYILSDSLSARLTLDTNGAVVGRQAHLPFGEDFAESGVQQKQHFTSYERDGQGTDYALNRNYSASTGRFHSADPAEQSEYATVPQSWNRYAYVMNAPVDFVDPPGLYVEKPSGADPCIVEPPPPLLRRGAR